MANLTEQQFNGDFRKLTLCVGIDPHASLLEKWGLSDNADGAETFVKSVIEAASDFSPNEICLKPQLSFFERHGSKGLAILEKILDFNSGKIPVIMDAKRGDIGSTMHGYADAFVKADSPFLCNAVTISPYLGPESTREFCETAAENSKTVFLLCLTSNPEAVDLQIPVAKQVFEFAKQLNSEKIADGKNPCVGLVVGATIKDRAQKAQINFSEFNGAFLAPGIGAQGATAEDIDMLFGNAKNNVIASASRSILQAGPSVSALKNAISEHLEQLKN